MKRTALSIIFACCAMAMAAQNTVTVKFQGAKPTISDFVWALINDHDKTADDEECADESFNGLAYAWKQYHKGRKLEDGKSLTIDTKNGYACYEYRSQYEQTVDLVRVELCYWNEADQKHKLLAYNVQCYRNGNPDHGQFDGLIFYRYNNATKKMTFVESPGFEVQFGTGDGGDVTYELPRTGKNITKTSYWSKTGKKRQQTLVWNGSKFSLQ